MKKRKNSRAVEGEDIEMALWGSAVQARYAPPLKRSAQFAETIEIPEGYRILPAVIETANGLTIVRKAVPISHKKCGKSVGSSGRGAA